MKRRNVGKYEVTSAGGEEVRAFIPNPLPPEPPIDIASLLPALSRALISLGRLDGLARILPNTLLFLYSYVRKEAVLSSQIEGTQSTISDLMLLEIKDMPGAPTEDVVEVSKLDRWNSPWDCLLRPSSTPRSPSPHVGPGTVSALGRLARRPTGESGHRPPAIRDYSSLP